MATLPKKAPKATTAAGHRAAPAAMPEDAATKALKVVPKRAGFRRAGYAFPDGETTIALSELTPAQYEQLTTEPMLVTFLVEVDAADEAAATPANA